MYIIYKYTPYNYFSFCKQKQKARCSLKNRTFAAVFLTL